MKKILSLFLVLGALLGASLAESAPALAANCSIVSKTPQLLPHGLQWPTTWTCSNVDEVQSETWAFENTWSVGGDLGQSAPFNVTAYNCNTVSTGGGYGTCVFTTYINTQPCPFGASGIGPFWWGHGEKFRIHRPAGDGYAGSWGQWTTAWSQASAGLYATCFNN